MTNPAYFEDYIVGTQRSTTGRTITEADIVLHAGQTGDFYPHHMDEEWCRTQPFGRRIAHGTLIFSVGVGLTASIVNPYAISYGTTGCDSSDRCLSGTRFGSQLRSKRSAISRKGQTTASWLRSAR
ncbi:MAG: hypothetical protein QOE55_8210 [Acidobacteriaceae bacterium]|nr:hypothetical protein [Acidobacteriaceae bacterium]